VRIAPRAYDEHDNARIAFKHVIDEIAALLGLKSDSDPRVSWTFGHEKPKKPRYQAIRIVVTERAA
jgi:hypothetical protein